MDALPVVLLGLWSAELVYGTSLCLPGQFVPGAETSDHSKVSFVRAFQDHLRSVAPVPSNHHSTPFSYVPRTLATASQVFVCHDAVRRPVQCPYEGPFPVLERNDKFFTINRGGE